MKLHFCVKILEKRFVQAFKTIVFTVKPHYSRLAALCSIHPSDENETKSKSIFENICWKYHQRLNKISMFENKLKFKCTNIKKPQICACMFIPSIV